MSTTSSYTIQSCFHTQDWWWPYHNMYPLNAMHSTQFIIYGMFAEHACPLWFIFTLHSQLFSLLRHAPWDAALCNSSERNSFSGSRFQLQWRLGMFLGLKQPGGGLTSVWAQSRYAAPWKTFCHETPRPTSSAVAIIMCTHTGTDIPAPGFGEMLLKRRLVSPLMESQGSLPTYQMHLRVLGENP